VRITNRWTMVLAATAALGLLTACGGGSSGGSGATVAPTGPATGNLEVFSWWTSGSENAALEDLFKVTKAANPQINIVNAAVAGGAGTNAKQVLATRLSGGDIPATWQTRPGGELKDYVDQGVVENLTPLYQANGWDKVVPKDLVDSMTYDGKTYGVITGVHRGNVLWTNTKLLKQAGVTLSDSTSWTQLQAAAQTLKSKGIVPLCLGDKDIWASAQLLESMIIGEVGPQKYMGLLDGSVKWTDPAVTTAVNHFSTALTWANSDHKALDWTGAVAAFAANKCAMNLMGDWAYGELQVKQKLVEGKDFGYTIIGDANVFSKVADTFVVGTGSKNVAGADAWVTAIMSKDAQLNFNKLKGASPVRTDLDLSSLGAYQQQAAKTLASGTKVPSLIQGQANTTPAVTQAFSDAVTLLAANKDASKFAQSMDAAITTG
jgi:glucose/mannose transport system substrate-binding protein